MREVQEIENAVQERKTGAAQLQPFSIGGEETRESVYRQLSEDSPLEAEPTEYAAPVEPVKEEPPPAKTVPLAALHEERMERKRFQEQNNALMKEIDAMKQEQEQLRAAMAQNDIYIDPSVQAILSEYNRKIATLDKRVEEIHKRTKEEEALRQQQAIETRARALDEQLAREGYAGFYDFIPHVVHQMDKEGIPYENRNEAEWRRIFVNHVIPNVINKYARPGVEERKRLASTIQSPGGNINPEPQDSGNDIGEYIKYRIKHSASGGDGFT